MQCNAVCPIHHRAHRLFVVIGSGTDAEMCCFCSGAFAAVVKATGKADHRPYAIKVVTRSAYRHYYHMMNQVQVDFKCQDSTNCTMHCTKTQTISAWLHGRQSSKSTWVSSPYMLTVYARRMCSSYLAFEVVLCHQLHLPELAACAAAA